MIAICSCVAGIGGVISYFYIEDEKTEIKPFVTSAMSSDSNTGGYQPPVVSSLQGNKTSGGYGGPNISNTKEVHSPFVAQQNIYE